MALVFQYGSNTSTDRLNSAERLEGTARAVGLARTDDEYDVAFTYFSHGNACAAADLISGRQSIYGVLYDIPDHRVFRHLKREGARTLDEVEGTGYQREKITVELVKQAGRLEALTYRVVDRRTGLQTAPHYVKNIVEGLRAHGAPETYVGYVKQCAALSNPDLADSFMVL
jgi:hypothetical protein